MSLELQTRIDTGCVVGEYLFFERQGTLKAQDNVISIS